MGGNVTFTLLTPCLGVTSVGQPPGKIMVRATDAKEVGVENPAEETFCHPNRSDFSKLRPFVNARDKLISVFTQAWQGMNLCGAHPFASNPLPALGCVSSHLSWRRDRRTGGLSAQEPPGTARCGNAKSWLRPEHVSKGGGTHRINRPLWPKSQCVGLAWGSARPGKELMQPALPAT